MLIQPPRGTRPDLPPRNGRRRAGHQRHSHALRRALAAAVEWIADAVEWINGPRTSPPPSPPDSEPWKDLIAAVTEDT